jgi:hypothetical protein
MPDELRPEVEALRWLRYQPKQTLGVLRNWLIAEVSAARKAVA